VISTSPPISGGLVRGKDVWVPPSQRFEIIDSSEQHHLFQQSILKTKGYLNKITPQKFNSISKKLVDITNRSPDVRSHFYLFIYLFIIIHNNLYLFQLTEKKLSA
jgi:hypothetical protein